MPSKHKKSDTFYFCYDCLNEGDEIMETINIDDLAITFITEKTSTDHVVALIQVAGHNLKAESIVALADYAIANIPDSASHKLEALILAIETIDVIEFRKDEINLFFKSYKNAIQSFIKRSDSKRITLGLGSWVYGDIQRILEVADVIADYVQLYNPTAYDNMKSFEDALYFVTNTSQAAFIVKTIVQMQETKKQDDRNLADLKHGMMMLFDTLSGKHY